MRADYIPADLYKLIEKYMMPDNALALRLSLVTGLRIDDVLSLRSSDLLRCTVFGTSKKTGKAFRHVINKTLADCLRRNSAGSPWLFPSHATDSHKTRQAVYIDVRKACKACGVTAHVSPHSARKTFAADLYHREGLQAVKDALQHDNYATTLIYALSDKMDDQQQGRTDAGLAGVDLDRLADMIADKVVHRLRDLL